MLHISRRQLLGAISTLSVGIPLSAALGEARLALSGYDPVAYFTEGHPENGLREFTAVFDDATYCSRVRSIAGNLLRIPSAMHRSSRGFAPLIYRTGRVLAGQCCDAEQGR